MHAGLFSGYLALPRLLATVAHLHGQLGTLDIRHANLVAAVDLPLASLQSLPLIVSPSIPFQLAPFLLLLVSLQPPPSLLHWALRLFERDEPTLLVIRGTTQSMLSSSQNPSLAHFHLLLLSVVIGLRLHVFFDKGVPSHPL